MLLLQYNIYKKLESCYKEIPNLVDKYELNASSLSESVKSLLDHTIDIFIDVDYVNTANLSALKLQLLSAERGLILTNEHDLDLSKRKRKELMALRVFLQYQGIFEKQLNELNESFGNKRKLLKNILEIHYFGHNTKLNHFDAQTMKKFINDSLNDKKTAQLTRDLLNSIQYVDILSISNEIINEMNKLVHK